ncbi:hypothetical protein [Alteromonas sediminis]|uniref:hypothetical protein n=1 Tax=Alteromonas sediminis TaxID=2259342 RepID=UPI0014049E3C|nr:hypothetical protein [Alteromonas sediminis]
MDKGKSAVTLSAEEIDAVSGAGFFYELGKFFAEVSNANDAIYDQYGNTNSNHLWNR